MSLPKPSAYFGTAVGTDANGTPVDAELTPRWSYFTGILSSAAKCPGCDELLRNHTVITYVGLPVTMCIGCVLNYLTERDAMFTARANAQINSDLIAALTNTSSQQQAQQNQAVAGKQTGGGLGSTTAQAPASGGPTHWYITKFGDTHQGTPDWY